MTSDLSHRAVYTLRSADSWRDPYPMYAALRTHDPVHHVAPSEPGAAPTRPARSAPCADHTRPARSAPGADDDFWVLTRHADVLAAADDPATFSSAQGLTVTRGELEAIGMADNPPMVMLDPPRHTQFRKLVARGFTPRQVTEIEPKVREFVVSRLETLNTDGPTDIVGDLFKPLPSMVVAHYLGVPEEDWGRFDGWTQSIVGATSGVGGLQALTPGDTGAVDPAIAAAGAATMELLAYFSELITFRKRNPAQDTVSQLVDAGLADDPADPSGLLSILAFAFTMVAGGNDTTTGMLGGSVDLLHRYPDQRRALLDDPELLPAAIDELLRLTSPVQGLARTTTRDVDYPDTPAGPVRIPADSKVLLCYGSANRDPAWFGDDAAHLDVTRAPRSILTFSHGNHHCLGAAAARMQARVALTEVLARFPDFAVDSDGIEWAPGNYVRRPTYVPFYAAGHR